MGGTLEDDKPADKEVDVKPSSSTADVHEENAQKVPEDSNSQPKPQPVSEVTTQRPATSSGWLGGWLSRPALQPQDTPGDIPQDSKMVEEPTAPTEQQSAPIGTPIEQPTVDVQPKDAPKSIPATTTSSSWFGFGLWSTAATSAITEQLSEQMPIKLGGDGQDTVMEDTPAPAPAPAPETPPQTLKPAAGSSWAFWSTETSTKASDPPARAGDSGQLAVAGVASETHPEPAKTETVKDKRKAKSSKRGRPQSMEVDEATRKANLQEPVSSKASSSTSPVPAKVSPPNLLLP